MKKPFEKSKGFGVLWLLYYRGKMSEKYGFGDYLETIEKVVPKLHIIHSFSHDILKNFIGMLYYLIDIGIW